MGSFGFLLTLALAFAAVFVPALLAEPSDAMRIGFFGEDFEGNLCGVQATAPDGRRGRDLRSRPLAYWMNASAVVCVPKCPRLADELVCEYPLESLGTPARRAQLDHRCFAFSSASLPSLMLVAKPSGSYSKIQRAAAAFAWCSFRNVRKNLT